MTVRFPSPAGLSRRRHTTSPGWAALAAATLLGAVAVTVVSAPTAASAAPAPPSGMSLVWSDDFNGAANTGLDSANWLYDLGTSYPGGAGNWGTGEVETVTNSTNNVYQDGNGHLVIKPIRDSAGNWTSGRVETQRTDFAAPPGGKVRIEASLQQPNVSGAAAMGYWPAFWAMGAAARGVGATNWPSIGEWDIMEDVNGRSSEFGTFHCGVDPGGPCNETTGISSGEHACSGCQTGFHTYALEYDRSTSPEQLRWYLDGNNFFTINANQVDATTWANATQHGMFVILNVAMGGAFPAKLGGGPTTATQSGVPMTVDYVAVYQSGSTGGGGTTGGTGPITGIGGKCVDVNGANNTNGTAVQLYTCNNSSAQQWTVQSDGTIRALGKCLDVTGAGTANLTPVELYDCNANGGQIWHAQSNGTLLNPASGRCLDDPGFNTADRTQLVIWDCNGGTNQQWHLS